MPLGDIMSSMIRVLGMIGTMTLLLLGAIQCRAADSTPDLTAELLSASSSDVNKVREFLDAGAPVNATGKEGMTALLMAVQSGKPEMWNYSSKEGLISRLRIIIWA